MRTISDIEKEQFAIEEKIRLIDDKCEALHELIKLHELRKKIRVKNAYMPKNLLKPIQYGLQGISSMVTENIEAIGIENLYQFAWCSEDDLKTIKGINSNIIEQIKRILEDNGIGLGHLTPLPFLSVPYTLSSIPDFYTDYDSMDLECDMLNIWINMGKYDRVKEYVAAQFYHYERAIDKGNKCNNELVN